MRQVTKAEHCSTYVVDHDTQEIWTQVDGLRRELRLPLNHGVVGRVALLRRSVLQCGAVCCSVLQCGVAWCSVLQCGAVCCSVLQCDMTHTTGVVGQVALTGNLVLINEAAQLKGALVGDSTQVVQSLLCCAIAYTQTATHCNSLQLTATHCNFLQLTATHCNTLQHAGSAKPVVLCDSRTKRCHISSHPGLPRQSLFFHKTAREDGGAAGKHR